MDSMQYADEATPIRLLQSYVAFQETNSLTFDAFNDANNDLIYDPSMHFSHNVLARTMRPLSTLERWITVQSKEDPFSPEATLHCFPTGRKAVGIGPVGIDLLAPQSFWASGPHHHDRTSPVETIFSSATSRGCSSCYSDEFRNADATGHYLSYNQQAYFNGNLPQTGARDLNLMSDTSGIALPHVQLKLDLEQDSMSTSDTSSYYHVEQSHFTKDNLSFQQSTVESEDVQDQDAEGESYDLIELTFCVKGEDSESDYNPTTNKPKRARTGRGPKHCVDSPSLRSKITKRTTRKHSFVNRKHIKGLNCTLSKENAVDSTILPAWTAVRPFSCPLTPYGCQKTFTSKNEWKRHITSQHICPGFWRCDLCPDMLVSPNDFNRKDLFTQHLRRMHSAPCSRKDASRPESDRDSVIKHDHDRRLNRKPDTLDEALEDAMEDIRIRCWIPVRELPTKISCVFCGKRFTKTGSFERWLEHVGHHMAVPAHMPRLSARNYKDNERSCNRNPVEWDKDELLREWLLSEGLLETGKNEGTWTIMGRRTTANGRFNVSGRQAEAQVYNEHEDAEGEDD